jgi:hypothetical protein
LIPILLQLEINTLGDDESRERYKTVLTDYFTSFKKQLSIDNLKRLPEVYLLDNQQIRAWQCIEDIGFQR